MKYIITAFICACMISACGTKSTPVTTKDSTTQKSGESIDPLSMQARILGTYKGDFGGSPIYVTINYCSGNKIAGYNTHKGLRRNLSGSITPDGKAWKIVLSEPGDHEFDGVFTLQIDESLSKASGSWKPSNSKSLSEKSLTLTPIGGNTGIPSYLSGDHSDIEFAADGNCTLNYYERLNDSTFSPQMNTLRGTWESKDSLITVNWQSHPDSSKRSSVFTVTRESMTVGEVAEDEKVYRTHIEGDGLVFAEEMY